jgi:putative hydrolase
LSDETWTGNRREVGSESFLNQRVAERLREAAELLEQQQANPFRVSAYRRAAQTVAGLDEDVAALLEREGIEGLDALPGIGSVLAQAIAQMVRTGRWAQLERLRGAVAPEQLFQSIPGFGPELARRIHEHLDVDTLEALELAAHDGRLEQVPGIGPRRAAMLRATLAGMLARTRSTRGRQAFEPGVDLLLDVDREYREKADRSALPRIAPRRFNPTGEAWLPILHTERGDWRFTALFSNSALAHELGRVRDWVVIYFHQDSGPEGQRTVVTETRGPLAGRRVVRGRESECPTQPDPAAEAAERGGLRRQVPSHHEAVVVGSCSEGVTRRSKSTTSSSFTCRKSS